MATATQNLAASLRGDTFVQSLDRTEDFRRWRKMTTEEINTLQTNDVVFFCMYGFVYTGTLLGGKRKFLRQSGKLKREYFKVDSPRYFNNNVSVFTYELVCLVGPA